MFDGEVFRGEVRRLDGVGETPTTSSTHSATDSPRPISSGSWTAPSASWAPGTPARGRTIALMRRILRTYAVQFSGGRTLPNVSCGPRWMPNATAWKTPASCGSPTTTAPRYYATYTAYGGAHISQQLLETADFLEFSSSPLVGPAAANKGLALFPRRIGGRYVALSRSDRETNTVAFSTTLGCGTRRSHSRCRPGRGKMLQLGNCGSPIETEAGWLVLTHGVGPMRTYRIGALLLDLDDPSTVIGQLREPLVTPAPDEQDGYVPNVVYSCGALVHQRTLVIPYGIGDSAIGIATVALPELLEALTPAG